VRADAPSRATTVEAQSSLAGASATSYNPFGTGGGDNAAEAALAIDAKPGTAWSTNVYGGGALHKPGVGLYLTLRDPLAANRLALTTPTPGFDMQVWASNRITPAAPARATTLTALGWRLLGRRSNVGKTAEVDLSEPNTRFTYYLVWITRLEPGAPGAGISAKIADISLAREQRG